MEEINEHINAIIAKYFAGEASLEEKDELTTWIEENKEHARWFARLKDLDQAIHPSFTPSAIHTEQAHEKFMDQLRRESRNQKFRTLMIRCPTHRRHPVSAHSFSGNIFIGRKIFCS